MDHILFMVSSTRRELKRIPECQLQLEFAKLSEKLSVFAASVNPAIFAYNLQVIGFQYSEVDAIVNYLQWMAAMGIETFSFQFELRIS